MQDTKLLLLVNRLKRQLLSRVWLSRILLIGLILLAFFIAFLITRPLISPLLSFLTPLSSQLAHSSGRTNIVFLGVGGPGHEAPDLTDTIILASIQLNTGDITLLSIPRDLWVPSMRAKINTAYHYGEERRPGSGGLVLAKSSVSEVTGQPVHYAAVLNFSAFIDLVDLIDGLDVDVPKPFTDTRYPLPGKEDDDCGGQDPEYLCRYETITFSSGLQHMDGSSALKFVRSRHSSDDEGTDYARSRRQTEILLSLQTKLTSLVKDPRNLGLLRRIYRLAVSSVITDFPSQPLVLARLGLMARHQDLTTAALAEPDTLYHPPVSEAFDNQWVLIPRDNNPQVIFDFVTRLLD